MIAAERIRGLRARVEIAERQADDEGSEMTVDVASSDLIALLDAYGARTGTSAGPSPADAITDADIRVFLDESRFRLDRERVCVAVAALGGIPGDSALNLIGSDACRACVVEIILRERTPGTSAARTTSDDDGKRGRGQPAPHETQQGADTPGHRASEAAGNVADPHLTPIGRRGAGPSSSTSLTVDTLTDEHIRELLAHLRSGAYGTSRREDMRACIAALRGSMIVASSWTKVAARARCVELLNETVVILREGSPGSGRFA